MHQLMNAIARMCKNDIRACVPSGRFYVHRPQLTGQVLL
jgi:hypothetical protein